MPPDPNAPSKKGAAFWNDRFGDDAYVYGTAPNAWVADAAPTFLATPTDVLDLGAGEGRNAVFLAEQGHRVTAADYSEAGLRKTQELAEKQNVRVEAMHVDVATWTPQRTWGGIVVTFLHGPDAWRAHLYALLHDSLAPGGCLIAEWFRPEQRTKGYTSGGPPRADMMVTADELRTHFDASGIERLDVATPTLNEGPHHRGPAATVRFVWRKPV
jgi:SAM-dependent methyltransferase